MDKKYDAALTFARIKQNAKERGYTLQQLSVDCGLSENAIRTAGKSTDGMKARNICMICKMLGCSSDYLLGMSDEKMPHETSVKMGDAVNNGNGFQAVGNVSIQNATGCVEKCAEPPDIQFILDNIRNLDIVQRAKIITLISEMMEGKNG